MDTIGNLLDTNRFQNFQNLPKPKREVNTDFEEARQFSEFGGGKVSTIVVLKFFKKYGNVMKEERPD